MKVAFRRDVLKQLQQLPRETFGAALAVIVTLGEEPRRHGAVKLAGSSSDDRIRIGQYRIVYEVDDATQTVTVFTVAKRSDAYRP